MINPRTAPYPVHQLMALKHEIKDSLSKEEYSGLLNSDILVENPAIEHMTIDRQLKSKLDLPVMALQNAEDFKKPVSFTYAKTNSVKWTIYVIGGIFVAVAIYVYYQHAKSKEKVDQGTSEK
ncbi:hypothetical protein [Flavitalea sp.]|nr:hypothetical protein [Flavitalea sp.]